MSFRKSGKRLILLGRTSGDPGATYGEEPTGQKYHNILPVLPLHHAADGLDCVDGISQGFVDADADVDIEERLAICTIDGEVNESEAHAIMRRQINVTENHGNDADRERS